MKVRQHYRHLVSRQSTHEYLQAGFTQCKDWYKRYGTLVTDKFYDEFIQFSRFCESNSILETGAGPGNGVKKIHPHISPTCKYIASDMNTAFLEEITALKIPNVTALEANFEHLPFANASFDRYVSNMAIHNAQDPQAPLQEAYRVLTKGGIAGVTVFGENDKNTYMELNKKFREFTGMPYHDSLIGNLRIMGSTMGIRELALSAGFDRAFVYGLQSVYPFGTPDEAMELFMSFEPYQAWMMKYPDKAQEFAEFVYAEVYKLLVERGQPIGFEGIVMLAFKE